MIFGVAAFVVALGPACNPLVATSHDSADIVTLREDIGRNSDLVGISVLSVKGRLATVRDATIAGSDTAGKWSKNPGPAGVLHSVWAADYMRNNPVDLYRTFTFVEVLNARGQHLVTLSPPECGS